MTTPVDVTGGAGGIKANRESIVHLASRYGDAAGAAKATAWLMQRQADALGGGLFAGDFGDAARHDYVGLLAAQAVLGPAIERLRRGGDGAGELSSKLLFAAAGYPWGAEPFHGVLDGVVDTLGLLSTFTSPLRPFVASTRSVFDERSMAHRRDSDLVERLVDASGLPAISAAASEIADWFGDDVDGRGVANAVGIAGVAPPRGLPDLIGGLGQVSRTKIAGGVDVRVLTDARGARRAVVDITGTRTWVPGGTNPADLTTNMRALDGHATAYAHGVLAALRHSGVRRGEPVMLVGHSQGGMIAVNVAAELARTGEFTVTHVVTAGAPISIGVARLSPSVRVLALENSNDVVPRLDGRPNPDRPSLTTVSGSHGGSHSVDASYRPLAAAAQREQSRSIRDFLASAGGFFTATRAEQHLYRIERR